MRRRSWPTSMRNRVPKRSKRLARAACIGAVNWAEVLSKAAETAVDPEAFLRELKARGILDQTFEVVPLLPEDGAGDRPPAAQASCRPPAVPGLCDTCCCSPVAERANHALPVLRVRFPEARRADPLAVEIRQDLDSLSQIVLPEVVDPRPVDSQRFRRKVRDGWDTGQSHSRLCRSYPSLSPG